MPTFRQDVLWYGSVGLVDEFIFICLRLDRMYYGMALLGLPLACQFICPAICSLTAYASTQKILLRIISFWDTRSIGKYLQVLLETSIVAY